MLIIRQNHKDISIKLISEIELMSGNSGISDGGYFISKVYTDIQNKITHSLC